MKTVIIFISLWPLAALSWGQDRIDETVDLQVMTDELLGYPDTGADYEDLYENLAQALAAPFDLNKVSREELRSLHILTDSQIESLLAYRAQQGALLDVYELQAVPQFDLATISKLIPFVRVVDVRTRINRSLLQRIFSAGHGYFIARHARTLETKKGFRTEAGQRAAYTGSADQLYWRLRTAIPGDFSIGLTGEKDAGEKIVMSPRDHQLAFDFTSFHLQLQNKGGMENIVIGDFQSQFGQGLLLGGAFGLGKGSESVSTTRKSNLGFRPYTSINESAYQRGAAFTTRFGSAKLSAFYSRTRRDASLEEASDTLSITAFQTSGYHRTQSELQKRKKVSEQNAGLVLQYAKRSFDAGIILNAIHFDTPVKRNPTLYNQYTFRGRENVNAGFFANYNLDNISVFTEFGRSLSAGGAVLAGLLISAQRNLDIAIVYRNYAPDFHTFYANAFSEGTKPQNERGVYWGWKYRWNRQWSFGGYVDLFTFPWLGFRRYAPSRGYEWLSRVKYEPSKQVSVFATVREELKYRNVPAPVNLYKLEPGKKRNLTVSCDYGIGGKIRLKSRVQFNQYHFDEKVTKGIAMLQDVSFSAGRFTFTGRHALFDTDNYDNRNYVYEHDAWLAYSLPSYAGTGVRNYALIEYKVHKRLTLWFRYARTALTKGDEIGSGNDLIHGNTKNDVKFQARFKF